MHNYIRLFKFAQYALEAGDMHQFKRVCQIGERNLRGFDFITFENMIAGLWKHYINHTQYRNVA
jgi:hypothetical protein